MRERGRPRKENVGQKIACPLFSFLIYYHYAKIIAKSAFGAPDGREAKAGQYGFVKERFKGVGGRS